jgi:3,4-dihydroxy 2-butanone 4-phosphate synthase/GTP cyclohydrolase II
MNRTTNTVEDALQAIARSDMVVVIDDPSRENEGDLVMAADAVTADAINFMVKHGRGLVCLPMEPAVLDRLRIGPMVGTPRDGNETNFTVSIDLAVPGSTGISAADRARTIRTAVAPDARPADFRRPGHVFPLRYADGGVLARRGHTEAAVDLARLAGRAPAGVICEIMADDGTMASGDALVAFADAHGLPIVTIEDLVHHVRRRQPAPATPRALVRRCVETQLPTRVGRWRAVGYETADGTEQLALVLGEPGRDGPPLVRVHSECLTGDVLQSRRCDCGDQLESAMVRIARAGAGVVVYLRGQEGRGIGLVDKLFAYALQDQGLDTVDANLELGLPVDARSYRAAAAILADLGLDEVRLLTNNPEKVRALEEDGIAVVERIPIAGAVNLHNQRYLETKRARMGHLDADAQQPAVVTPLPRKGWTAGPGEASERQVASG